ncbi:hypothetical protein SeLEV6574_g06194 [Synchytrium endobioticum]|uniref:Uncharacterized protein n=1 Tax=Synchytrium endobioticum TaxID=286115 RepID=A0A507CQ38_9FUNG|nr:hypothetical protein SeLEV6574_g06194 [Synchytrium endobioticum]
MEFFFFKPLPKHFRIHPRCCSIKMGKNIKIVAVAALLIFCTFTPSDAGRRKKIRTPDECLDYIRQDLLTLESKMSRVELNMNSGRNYRTITMNDVLSDDIQERFQSLENPKLRWPECLYNQQLVLGFQTPDSDICWQQVCFAHEYLIIARALYDVHRLRCLMLRDQSAEEKGPERLLEYFEFIRKHVDRKLAFPRIGVGLTGPLAALTDRVDSLLVQENLSAGTGRTPQSTDPVDKTELDLIGLVGRTSDPMVTSTDDVDWQTQELLGQHREGDSDAPPSVMFEFFRQAGEQASGFSHDTHYTEGYQAPTYFEQQSVPQPFIPHHAAESSTHGHDNRNRGKMPMHDDSSAPSCYPYYPYHSPDGEHHRR